MASSASAKPRGIGEITHHYDIVVTGAPTIEPASGALAETVTLVEALRGLVGPVGTKNDRAVAAPCGIRTCSFDESVGDAAALPRLINAAL